MIGLAPLVLPALTGVRNAPDDLGGWMLRLWPLAALVVLCQPFGTFPAHALQGITLPLVTLAFLGDRRDGGAGLRWRRARAADRAGHGLPRRRAAQGGQRRPPAVLPHRRRARALRYLDRAPAKRRRARAGLQRPARPGVDPAGDVGRRGLVDAGLRRARAGGRAALLGADGAGGGRGAGARVGRALPALRLPRPRRHPPAGGARGRRASGASAARRCGRCGREARGGDRRAASRRPRWRSSPAATSTSRGCGRGSAPARCSWWRR